MIPVLLAEAKRSFGYINCSNELETVTCMQDAELPAVIRRCEDGVVTRADILHAICIVLYYLPTVADTTCVGCATLHFV